MLYMHNFPSLRALLDACINAQEAEPLGRYSRKSGDSADQWAGASWEDACQLAVTGDKQLGAIIRQTSDRLVRRLSTRVQRPRWVYAEEGSAWDLPRVLDGDLSQWWAQSPRPETRTGARTVTVGVDLATSAGVSTDTMRKRGIAVAGLVRCFDLARVRAQVVVLDCTCRGKYKSVTRAIIKQASQDIDYDILGYVIAHPSMMRRLILSLQESYPTEERLRMGYTGTGGYGTPDQDPPAEVTKGIDIFVKASHLYDSDLLTDPEKWVLDQLAKQGITIRR